MNESIRPHTALTRRLVRAILGFGVGVAVGLAPYLGTVGVPGFQPLLNLYPLSIRNVAIPLAAALMGIVAVVVDWYGAERLTPTRLRRMFWRTLTIVGAGFVLLIVVHTAFVVAVPIEGGSDSVSFVIGWTRQATCNCGQELSDAQCIQRITFNLAAVDACWGDRGVRFAKLVLILSYLLFTGAFGVLVGITIVRAAAISNRPDRRSRDMSRRTQVDRIDLP